MSNRITAILLASTMALSSACDSGSAADPEVAKAAKIAKDIEAAPDKAEATLKAAGMSVEDFESLMMDIAADPEKTKAFEAAKAG